MHPSIPFYSIPTGVLESHERGEGAQSMRESSSMERDCLSVQGALGLSLS